MRALRPRLPWADLAVPVFGGAATLVAAYASVQMGARISVGALLVVFLFVGAVLAFIAYPHVAVAVTVALFALVPTLKVFVSPEIGAVKDLIVFAAASAALLVVAIEGRRADRPTSIIVLLFLALYVINAGGGHGIAWAHGARLVAEPLLLLLVGLVLPQPRRTFRYAIGALIVTCCIVAGYGIIQQLVGKYTLVDWGYSFDEQVRSLPNGTLRSFGTLDDPFAYAVLLAFGIVGIVFWLRRGVLAWSAGLLVVTGLALGFARTSILMAIVLVGLLLWRWGYSASGVLVAAAACVVTAVVLVNASGSQQQTYAVPSANRGAISTNVILNGRISAWEAALGPNPVDWPFGRGVGEVGTAAQRARYTLAPPSSDSATGEPDLAVDSGYLATIADVGLAGLALLVALFARLFTLASEAARRGLNAGWVALGLLAVLLVDALTRASFTGFPTAFLSLLLIGICLAAAREESEAAPASTAAS